MIPANLQSGLVKRLEDVLSNFKLKNPNNEEITINIYKQNLPQLDADDDISLYPYILVKLADGEIADVTSLHKIKVLLIIGIFDDSLESQGDQDVLNVIQKVLDDFKKNPLIDNKFDLSYPVRWTIHEEDVYPFFFGGIETYWETNQIEREDIRRFL
jgi:hypothetical protein